MYISHVAEEALGYLLGRGQVGAVGAGGAVLGGGAAGDVVGVGQRPPLHLGQHALLVQQRLEEPRVAVELHQVEDLEGGDESLVGGAACEGGGNQHRHTWSMWKKLFYSLLFSIFLPLLLFASFISFSTLVFRVLFFTIVN